MRYTVLNQNKGYQLEKAKEAFVIMGTQYEKIFATGFYPARDSTGFTEQNLVHNYSNALVQIINESLGENGDAFAWLEFPWEDNKQHIDAIVISKYAKLVYYIEAKRLSVEQKKFQDLNNDIERIKKNYDNKIIINDLLTHHKINTSSYAHHIVAMADIWVTEQPKKNKTGVHFTKNIYDSWQKTGNLSDPFIKHTHLADLLQNSQHTYVKEFTSHKNYKLLIAVESLKTPQPL